MLNKEDREIFAECMKEEHNKLLPKLILITIIVGFPIILNLVFNNNIISVFVSLIIAVPVVLGLLSFVLKDLQINRWEMFFEKKSIIINSKNYEGVKIIIEDYIANKDSYYTEG